MRDELLDHAGRTMTAAMPAWPTAPFASSRSAPEDRRPWSAISTPRSTVPLRRRQMDEQEPARAEVALPNGSCGLPLQKSCPHANACLTCPLFVTTAEFPARRRHQLNDARALIASAQTDASTRLAEMNRTSKPTCSPSSPPSKPTKTTAGAPQLATKHAAGRNHPMRHDDDHRLIAAAQRRRADTLDYTNKPCRNSTKPPSGALSPRSPPTPASPAHRSTPSPNCATRLHALTAICETPVGTCRSAPLRPPLRQRLTLAHERIHKLDDEDRQLRNRISSLLHGRLPRQPHRCHPRHGHRPRRKRSAHAAEQSVRPRMTIVCFQLAVLPA